MFWKEVDNADYDAVHFVSFGVALLWGMGWDGNMIEAPRQRYSMRPSGPGLDAGASRLKE
jgi:hypothetical protein